ncbi:hypothetical protein FQN60_003071, partial [Etheostoma spectabile]
MGYLLSHRLQDTFYRLCVKNRHGDNFITLSKRKTNQFSLRYEDYNYPCKTINVKNSQPESEREQPKRVPLCVNTSRFHTGEFARDP